MRSIGDLWQRSMGRLVPALVPAQGVSARMIRLAVERAADGFRVEARYVLRADDPTDRRPLLFYFAGSPLGVERIVSDAADVTTHRPGRAVREREGLWLAPGASWDGAEIRITLIWTEGAPAGLPYRVSALVAPDFLPLPTVPLDPAGIDRTPLPLISLDGVVPPGLAFGGMAAGDSAFGGTTLGGMAHAAEPIDVRPGGELLQLALLPDAAAPERSQDGSADGSSGEELIRIGGCEAEGLSPGERERIRGTVRSAFDFLATTYGVRPAARLLVELDEPKPLLVSPGVWLVTPLRWYRLEPGGRRPNRFNVARTLGGLWWGGGVRVVGPDIEALHVGIAGAVAFRHAEAAGDLANRDGMLAAYRDIAGEYLRGARRDDPAGRSSAIAVALFEAMEREPAVLDALAALTREYRGQFLSQQTLLSRLAEAGCRLDLPR